MKHCKTCKCVGPGDIVKSSYHGLEYKYALGREGFIKLSDGEYCYYGGVNPTLEDFRNSLFYTLVEVKDD